MARKSSISSEINRRHIKEAVKMMLWGISAGRCEMCNCSLYVDRVFGVEGNYAELAHIHAVSPGGPRFVATMTTEEKNDISNLMLLCDTHHHMIDTNPEDYPGEYLIGQKKRHEDRIRVATEISDDQSCRMVAYFPFIDCEEIYSSENLFKQALRSSSLLPLQQPVIPLHAETKLKYEPNKKSFEEKATDLEKQVKSWFGGIIKTEDAIAIFTLAPQPLLIKLGTLINDQQNVTVFQCHRTGHKWAWKGDGSSVEYITKCTRSSESNVVALVIDLSAEVVDQRITRTLGENCSIYHITIEEPNRYFVTNKEIQDDYIHALRAILEQIKNEHQNIQYIHIFPAMPNSLAVRTGMDYMPKVDIPWRIYEQASPEQGFIETITIGG